MNRLNPSILVSLIGGGLSYGIADKGEVNNPLVEYGTLLPLFVGTWLVANHLPDYFLGGAWDHRKQIDVSMEKEEAD